MQFYEINICQVMIFRLYTVYNKCDMIKIVNQTREILQLLSQVASIINSNKFNCKYYYFQFLATEIFWIIILNKPENLLIKA